jgi:hypothetical protein
MRIRDHLRVERHRLLLLFLDDRQIDIVILGLATDAKSSCLYVGEDDADKFTKRRRIENRHSLSATFLSITAVHPISTYGAIALTAVFTQPEPKSDRKREG